MLIMDTRRRKKPVYDLNDSDEKPSHLLQKCSNLDEEVNNLQFGEDVTSNESSTYEVSGDDTLASIAAINKLTVSDLMRENKLISSLVHPGQLIKIPKQSPYGSCNSLTQGGGSSISNSKEDIKIIGGYEKVPTKRQRSISEYKRPRHDLLAIPENLKDKIDNKPRTRKVSLAVLVENVRSKFSSPPSPHEVLPFKQRAKSVAVPPKLSYFDFGNDKKERRTSEIKRKLPDPVSFPSEILHPVEDRSSGTLQLDGERLEFESDSGNDLSSYIFYSISYEDIVNVTLWKTSVSSEEPLDYGRIDQFIVLQVMDELKAELEDVREEGTESNIRVKYFLSAEITKDSPFFINQEGDSVKLWFSIFEKKLLGIDRHLSLALPHCYSNLPCEAKTELLYDLQVKLLRGEVNDINQNGLLNASVKFKIEKTNVFKSKTTHGGITPEWNETFAVENIIPDDIIRVKLYQGSAAIGRSFIPVSSLPLKISQSLTLEMEGVDESQTLKVGRIYLECLLLPKGSPVKMPCVPLPLLHSPSRIISRFHVAKACRVPGIALITTTMMMTATMVVVMTTTTTMVILKVEVVALVTMTMLDLFSSVCFLKLCDNLPRLLSSTQKWMLIYSNLDHGSSLTTLYSRMGECSSDDSVILVIKDSEQKVFGAYLTSPIKPSRSFYGTGECFLFTFYPFFQKFASSGLNMGFMRSDEEGISIGCGKAGDGLWIHENIWDGSTNVSESFNNLPLTANKTFHIIALETWKVEV